MSHKLDSSAAAVLVCITRLARPSVPYGLVSRNSKETNKKRKEIKIGINVSHQITNKWSGNF